MQKKAKENKKDDSDTEQMICFSIHYREEG